MGAADRKLALAHNPLLKEDPMLEIVPDPDASANRFVRRRLVAAFRAEVDERVGDGDFARPEEVALATSSPMEEDLPPGTPRRPRKKPRIRKAPPPVAVNYRMAFVGTVAFADADGDLVHTYRYGATAADGPADILRAMMQDLRNALRRDGSLRVVVVQDAAKEMWTLVIAALEAEPSVSDGEELVDHYHAMGHLWAAASIQADGDIEPAFTTETTEGWGRFIFRKLTPTAHLYPGPTATASSPAMCTVVSESMSGVTMAIIASVVDTATVQVGPRRGSAPQPLDSLDHVVLARVCVDHGRHQTAMPSDAERSAA